MVTDFRYDGLTLSSLGYAIVSFDGARDGEIDTDSKFTFEHIPMMRGKRQSFLTSTYEDPLVMEFHIAKISCSDSESQGLSMYDISLADMAYLKRWLVRPTPHKLQVLGDSSYDDIYWKGSFNLEEYVLGDGRIGAALTFECDAPFGYYSEVTYSGDLNANDSYEYNCVSDEIGWLYPTLTITLQEDGDLELTNSSDGRVTKVNNCSADEVITFTPKLQISSSFATHKIANDFNYKFYRINNQMHSIVNSIESNLAISYVIAYDPICKAVIV